MGDAPKTNVEPIIEFDDTNADIEYNFGSNEKLDPNLLFSGRFDSADFGQLPPRKFPV